MRMDGKTATNKRHMGLLANRSFVHIANIRDMTGLKGTKADKK